LKEQDRKALMLLEGDPYHPSIRLHALKGRLQPLHSISINLGYRITIEMMIDENEIILVNVGSREDIYR